MVGMMSCVCIEDAFLLTHARALSSHGTPCSASPSSRDLTIFDKRFGYTETEARDLLEAWGGKGTSVYIKSELVDMFVLFQGIFPLSL